MVTPGGLEPPTTGFGGQCLLFPQRGRLVDVAGVEPAASCVRGRRSSQLSYTPEMVEATGFEPASASLQGWCRAIATSPPEDGAGIEPA